MITILVLAMWAHTGSMPPLVVVESQSMVHDENGEIGSIDAGDLVLVHSPNEASITTYAEATNSKSPNYGDENHGMPGDVIIFKRNGGDDSTPIIHRAIFEVRANRTTSPDNGYCANGADIVKVDVSDEKGTCILSWDVPWTNIVDVEHISLNFNGEQVEGKYDCGIDVSGHGEFTLNVVDWVPKHPGYITLGDHNKCSDDQSASTIKGSEKSSPVRHDWIIGISGSEIPWLGVVKLMVSGDGSPGISEVPNSSFLYLITLVVTILVLPMLFEPIFQRVLKSSPEMKEAERKKAMDTVLQSTNEEE
jgi:signal peptidase